MFANKAKNEGGMTEAPFLRNMIAFTVPLLLTGILQNFYNAADLIVVGQFRGDRAVASVGSTGSLTSLSLGFFLGLSVGAGVLVAQYIGAKKYDEVQKVLHTSVLLSIIIGVVVSAFGFISVEKLLVLMNTPTDVLPGSVIYMRIIFLGVPGSMLYNYLASILRSAGDSKNPLIFLSVSGIANVVLNVIFVALLGMGVEGVAIATITAQYLSALLALIHFVKQEGELHFSFSKLSISGANMKKMLTIGVPSGIQSTLFSFSNVLIQSTVNGFGEDVVAGSAASSNIENFVYIALNSVYHVTLTFVGQNYGAGKYKNIKKIIMNSLLICFGIGVISEGIVIALRYSLLSLYVNSETALDVGITRLLIIVPLYFLCGFMEVFSAGLRSENMSLTSMIISLCGACAFRIIWINTIFNLMPVPSMVFITYPISWILTSGVSLTVLSINTHRIIKKREAQNCVV